jgi:hypothetical protein
MPKGARRRRRDIHLTESATTTSSALWAPTVSTSPTPVNTTFTVTAPPVRTAEAVSIRETPTIVESPVGGRPGRMLVRLITAGWNTSGSRYYPPAVLERDGPRVFSAGTLNFVDHATDNQEAERPEGSLRDLASVQTTDAYWDPVQQALMAEVRLFAPWRDAITDMAAHIGMSIRAEGMGEYGEAEGRHGLLVTTLTHGHSVDYVTKPGAGGGIVQVLESARTRLRESGSIGACAEAHLHTAATQAYDDMYAAGHLTRAERISLSSAIGDALDAFVQRVEADAPQLYTRDRWGDPPTSPPQAEPYAAAEATEPSDDTPITDAPGAPPANPEEGQPMAEQAGAAPPDTGGNATTAAVEAAVREHELARQLAEAATRETTLAEQLRTAQATATEAAAARAVAERETYRLRAGETVRARIGDALAADTSDPLPAVAHTRVADTVTAGIDTWLDEAGQLDGVALAAAISAAITAERAYLTAYDEARGAGRVRGLGETTAPATAAPTDEAALEAALTDIFESVGMNTAGAKLAAKGR